MDLLHDTVKAALIAGVDQDLTNDATQRQEGWLHIHGELARAHIVRVALTCTRYEELP